LHFYPQLQVGCPWRLCCFYPVVKHTYESCEELNTAIKYTNVSRNSVQRQPYTYCHYYHSTSTMRTIITVTFIYVCMVHTTFSKFR
jgi:hypothetical protein